MSSSVSCVFFLQLLAVASWGRVAFVLCFVFVQTQLGVKKWREAEVMDVRHSEAGTEVWVSGVGRMYRAIL